MAGWPILRTAPLATSSSATCPVECHSSSSFSNGVDIRLGNVRSRFRSESAILTVGLVGAAGAAGIGARPSGTWTKTIVLPSWLNSKADTSVASTGVFVSCRALPEATSANQMCVASSPCTKNAMPLLSGDHVAFDTRVPAARAIGFFVPSLAEISWMPVLLRMVRARARFAL